MANVVALVKDDRVRRQVETFLGELDLEGLRFATFKTQAEFQHLYFRDSAPEEEHDQTSEENEVAELKLFSEVHLLIFALDTIDGKPGPWIDRLRANLKRFKRYPANGQMRIILLKYEEDGIGKLEVLHPFLDDLIYLPLDRLVFLQKLQIFLTLPQRASPRYLFNQEVEQTIEISKIAKVDRFSDVGLAIRNPVPLKRGVPGHFYVQIPGEKSRIEIHGKVIRSEPHPDHPGQYLVYFCYFGLSRNNLTLIRRALSKAPQYKSFLDDDRNLFRYRADDLTLISEDDHKLYGVIIIDTDENAGRTLAQILNKEMDRLNIVAESSFQIFLHRYLNEGGVPDQKTPPRGTDPSDFYANPLTLTVSARDLKCHAVDPPPVGDSLFLGHPAEPLFSTADKWLSLLQDQEARLLLEEAVLLASRGHRQVQKLLTIVDAHNQRCGVNFSVRAGSDDATMVLVDLMPATLADIVSKMNSDNRAKSIDALIVDAKFVPDEPTDWLNGLRTRARKMGLLGEFDRFKLWIVSENEKVPPRWLEIPDILGVYPKPTDLRQLLFSLSENLPNKNSMYCTENLGWSQPGFPLHVSKTVMLEALSEFGATLKSKQKMAPGTVIYLRKSIYDNAPNACLAARVYLCEGHPNEKDHYQIFTTYFGINDSFLRFARTWIRENYAHQKAHGSGM